MAALCAIRDWTIAQIPDSAADLDQLFCDDKIMRASIEATAGGYANALLPTATTLPSLRFTQRPWVWPTRSQKPDGYSQNTNA